MQQHDIQLAIQRSVEEPPRNAGERGPTIS